MEVTPVRLWTIQPVSVWEQVRRDGRVRVDPARRSTPDYIPPAHLWLNQQLKKRLPNYNAELPWWAYRTRPDLRCHRWSQLPGGSRQVRLELEMEPEEVAVFRIWAWDRVFCGKYLGTRAQERDWRRRLRAAGYRHWDDLPRSFEEEREQSWLRVFQRLPRRRNATGEWGDQEAVLAEIRLENVVDATPFRCLEIDIPKRLVGGSI